jgi:colanic acid biosynthesis glycosyl transferase WcaI
VLLVNQFFHPSSAATSQLLTDLARHLAGAGAKVTAICGPSSYGGVNSGNLPGVEIRRVPSWPFARGRLGRVISYGSFYAGAFLLAITARRPGAILTLTTPPLLSLTGTLLKKIRGAPHFIWEMDIYPDIAVELGMLSPGGRITRLIGALADWSRRNADGVVVLGDDMKELLVARGIPADKIFVSENWADPAEISPLPFPAGPLHLLYSGNLGLAHDVETLLGAMLSYGAPDTASGIRFTFAGAGPRRESLEAFVRDHQLSNVAFRDYCPREQLGESLAEGHIGLVTQQPQVIGSVVPSKLYGILAAGRPVIYIGARGTTPARVIERFNCGWQIDPGDVRGLVALLKKLDNDRSAVYAAGARARKAFEENYTREMGVTRMERILTGQVTAERHSQEMKRTHPAGAGLPSRAGH